MSIRLGQRHSQANLPFEMAANGRSAHEKDSGESKPSRTGLNIEQAHTVRIESDGSHPLADEIAHKLDNSVTSTNLELHESDAERVSELLTRLRNLATTAGSDSNEFGTRDQLAAADEYRALQIDLNAVSSRIDDAGTSSDSERKKLAAHLRQRLNLLEDELSAQLSSTTSPTIMFNKMGQESAQSAASPMLKKLDMAIGQVEEYQSYLQQLRSAVDTQLMKPIGPNKELIENQQRHKIISRLTESKRQILESGCESLRSTKGLNPVVALQLLDSSD